MILLDLFFIHLIVVIVIDIIGFVDTLKDWLWLSVKGCRCPLGWRLRPFDCSLCMTFWCCMVYILVEGEFSLPYMASSLFLAVMCPVTGNLVVGIREWLIKITYFDV